MYSFFCQRHRVLLPGVHVPRGDVRTLQGERVGEEGRFAPPLPHFHVGDFLLRNLDCIGRFHITFREVHIIFSIIYARVHTTGGCEKRKANIYCSLGLSVPADSR